MITATAVMGSRGKGLLNGFSADLRQIDLTTSTPTLRRAAALGNVTTRNLCDLHVTGELPAIRLQPPFSGDARGKRT
jgi:hypothetical protein